MNACLFTTITCSKDGVIGCTTETGTAECKGSQVESIL